MTKTPVGHVAASVLTAALLVAAPAAFAGGQAQGPGPRGRVAPRAQRLPPAEIERLFDGYVVMQAQEALKLSDAQFGPFVAKLKALQETRRRARQARRALVSELARALGATPVPESDVKETLRKLREAQARGAEDEQKAYDAIDQVLDLPQQARFRVFEDTVERRKFDLVLRARGRAPERDDTLRAPR